MPYVGKKPADIIATAVDTTTGTFSGAVSAASVDADGGVTVDNITIDGTEIDLSSGSLTLDVAGNIVLDADSGEIHLTDGGTQFAQFTNSSLDFIIGNATQDKDILFKGNDGGSVITALTLDMSAAGEAKFNDNIVMGTANKGIHLGVTSATASNLLDDYEEGTWTPATSSSSYNTGSSTGVYTKIGRIVIAHFSINFSSVNSSSNSVVVITNFPFTNGGAIASAGTARESSNTGAVYTTRIATNTTTATLNSMDNVTNDSQRTIRTNENYVGTLIYVT